MIGDLRMLLVCLVSVAMLGLGDNGLRAAEPSQIDSLLRQAVDRGDVPCVVAMAATSEKVIYQGAFGKRSVAEDEDATLDTVFRIASMTKVVTSVAALQLVEQELLTLDTPVSRHIPCRSRQTMRWPSAGRRRASGGEHGVNDEATPKKPRFRARQRPASQRHTKAGVEWLAGIG